MPYLAMVYAVWHLKASGAISMGGLMLSMWGFLPLSLDSSRWGRQAWEQRNVPLALNSLRRS